MKKTVLGVMMSAAVWTATDASAAGEDAAGAPNSEAGYMSIFNGKDLAGWDGDPKFWSVKDGAIHGETTPDNPTKGNTFIIWRGGRVKDFGLKVKFRLVNGNSGIQYRSKEFEKWRIGGYQADIAENIKYVGLLYHEAGRGIVANVGESVVIDEKGKKNVVGRVADREELNKAGFYKPTEWNEYTIIARGNHILQYVNNHLVAELIDNDRLTDSDDPRDRKGAAADGLLALQLHAGPPMVVEFKDIRVKHLSDKHGRAIRLFNDKDFSGWTLSSNALKDTFSVKDGMIACTGKPAGYIRTKKDYTNYIVRLQLRHIKPGNSGLLLRVTGPDQVWPRSIEAQGASNSMGDIWNIGQFPMKVDAERTRGRRTQKLHPSNERPIGQWNDYEVYLSGGRLAIFVNRLLQNTATDCEEVAGRIGIQSEGSPKEFRNIVLIPIER
ncbi:MAG: 3-keto-disaccharide hydrolase [Planctomycetota bacterium]|jgi:hypothetical protein